MKSFIFLSFLLPLLLVSCEEDEPKIPDSKEWNRESMPVLRDSILNANYQVASDPHVFLDEGTLRMIYTGDKDDKPAIKLASAHAINDWTPAATLLGSVGPSGLDSHKETGFYRKAATGKHQIYYIGYNDEESYRAQIFLAESDSLTGPYTQMNAPVVERGPIAGEEVYCMTSPTVVEHDGLLYMVFIGWDNSPDKVTEVWVMGATSTDNGHSWNDFQKVDARIGMEGQVTKVNDDDFVAVRTGDYRDGEAIFYATAAHPFGPWTEEENPILVQAGAPYEKDEVIAPQVFIDPASDEEFLFYTGADYAIGWWVMMAQK